MLIGLSSLSILWIVAINSSSITTGARMRSIWQFQRSWSVPSSSRALWAWIFIAAHSKAVFSSENKNSTDLIIKKKKSKMFA